MESMANEDRATWRMARLEALRAEIKVLEDECVQEALKGLGDSDIANRCAALWDQGLKAQAVILYRNEKGGTFSVAKATVEQLMTKRHLPQDDVVTATGCEGVIA